MDNLFPKVSHKSHMLVNYFKGYYDHETSMAEKMEDMNFLSGKSVPTNNMVNFLLSLRS